MPKFAKGVLSHILRIMDTQYVRGMTCVTFSIFSGIISTGMPAPDKNIIGKPITIPIVCAILAVLLMDAMKRPIANMDMPERVNP